MARPSHTEQARRRKEFARLVAHGTPIVQAVRESRMDPWRALALLDEPEMMALLAAARPGVWTTPLSEA